MSAYKLNYCTLQANTKLKKGCVGCNGKMIKIAPRVEFEPIWHAALPDAWILT